MRAELKKMLSLFRELAEFVDSVESVESVERAAKEANARLEAARRQYVKERSDYLASQEDVLLYIGNTKKEADEIKQAAAALHLEAQHYAKELISDAETALANARAAADGIIKNASEREEEADRVVESKQIELAALEEKITEARARINQLLGA